VGNDANEFAASAANFSSLNVCVLAHFKNSQRSESQLYGHYVLHIICNTFIDEKFAADAANLYYI